MSRFERWLGEKINLNSAMKRAGVVHAVVKDEVGDFMGGIGDGIPAEYFIILMTYNMLRGDQVCAERIRSSPAWGILKFSPILLAVWSMELSGPWCEPTKKTAETMVEENPGKLEWMGGLAVCLTTEFGNAGKKSSKEEFMNGLREATRVWIRNYKSRTI